jgi:hypothetical protein
MKKIAEFCYRGSEMYELTNGYNLSISHSFCSLCAKARENFEVRKITSDWPFCVANLTLYTAALPGRLG